MKPQIDPNIVAEYNMQRNLQTEGLRQQADAEMQANAPYLVQQQQMTQAALVEQTNPTNVLKDIEMRLRGKEEKFDGTVVDIGKPLMNNKGIARIRTLLSAIVNQNTILSHLEDREIGRMIITLGDDLCDDLTLNWKDYDIKDKVLLDHIVDICLMNAYMALKRAWKQNEKNWLNKAVVENINTAPRMLPQKKETFMSRFKL